MTFSLTLVIVVVTSIVSFICFSNRDLLNKLIFYPPAIAHNKEWYRFFSHGLIHADLGHLAFNMIALYSFGEIVELYFSALFGGAGRIIFLLFYISALAISSIPTYIKNKDNSLYMSLGASGAVSSLVFAFMVLAPTQKIGILFLPFNIPAFIYGFLYIALSAYLDKRGTGNINHSAHLFGALYGIAFIVIACMLAHYPILTNFMEQIKDYVSPAKAANPFE